MIKENATQDTFNTGYVFYYGGSPLDVQCKIWVPKQNQLRTTALGGFSHISFTMIKD